MKILNDGKLVDMPKDHLLYQIVAKAKENLKNKESV